MPTDLELEKGAGFIRYEYLMLAEAARVWIDQDLGTYTSATKWNARMITDVFLLHTRNLLDFIAPTESVRPDEDVLARHYDPSWTRSGDSPLAGRTIAEWRRRINKLLSHVTYERTAIIEDSGAQRWPIEDMHNGVVSMLGDFLKTLPDSRREWFGPELQAAR